MRLIIPVVLIAIALGCSKKQGDQNCEGKIDYSITWDKNLIIDITPVDTAIYIDRSFRIYSPDTIYTLTSEQFADSGNYIPVQLSTTVEIGNGVNRASNRAVNFTFQSNAKYVTGFRTESTCRRIESDVNVTGSGTFTVNRNCPSREYQIAIKQLISKVIFNRLRKELAEFFDDEFNNTEIPLIE